MTMTMMKLMHQRLRVQKSPTAAKTSALLQKRFMADSTASRLPGAGLWQRLTSFVVGAGLTGVATQLYIYREIKSGNVLLIAKQKDIEQRLSKLEAGAKK